MTKKQTKTIKQGQKTTWLYQLLLSLSLPKPSSQQFLVVSLMYLYILSTIMFIVYYYVKRLVYT